MAVDYRSACDRFRTLVGVGTPLVYCDAAEDWRVTRLVADAVPNASLFHWTATGGLLRADRTAVAAGPATPPTDAGAELERVLFRLRDGVELSDPDAQANVPVVVVLQDAVREEPPLSPLTLRLLKDLYLRYLHRGEGGEDR